MRCALTDFRPATSAGVLLGDMVPPRHFATVSLANYEPAHPSQQVARDVVAQLGAAPPSPRLPWRRRGNGAAGRGLYLDGGFGVGKTHLLAALAHAVGPAQAAYATFAEYTHLVGLVGFAATRDLLATKRWVCIDEFELDDVADTLLISRLLRELMDGGVSIAVTSNTLPEALGEGRFAAADFAREIGDLARRFQVVSMDGHDYRQRLGKLNEDLHQVDMADLARRAAGATIAIDHFDDLVRHLASVHQGNYRELVRPVAAAVWLGTQELDSQFSALRLVVLIDRLYDQEVALRLDGTAQLFSPAMFTSGYRKKYLRATSRLAELTTLPLP